MLLAVATAIAALAVGCGGDDDGGGDSGAAGTPSGSSSSDGGSESASGSGSDSGSEPGSPDLTSSSLTMAQYVERANAICDQNNEDRFAALGVYGEEHSNEPEDEQLTGAAEDVIAPSMEELASQIRELGSPQDDEGNAEQIVAAFDRVAKVTRESEGDLLNRAIGNALKQAREVARSNGLAACNFR